MHAADRSRVIDMHCHTAGIGSGGSGCFVSPELRKSWRYRIYLRSFGVTEEEVREQGDGLIIRRLSDRLAGSRLVGSAVILALDGVVDSSGDLDLRRTEVFVPTEFIAGEVRKYDNLLYGASINPYRNDAIERLERASEERAALLKWLPSIQLIDPADRKLVPFYRRMQELRLPLLCHTGSEHSFTRAEDELADPERLRPALECGVTVIAAHAATSGRTEGVPNLRRLLPLFDTYPNLYADISSLTQLNKLGHLRRLLRHTDIHDRLLYGTDMPLIETAAVSPFYFMHTIGLRKALEVQGISNPWDRDVSLKLALGVPSPVLEKASSVLREVTSSIHATGRSQD